MRRQRTPRDSRHRQPGREHGTRSTVCCVRVPGRRSMRVLAAQILPPFEGDEVSSLLPAALRWRRPVHCDLWADQCMRDALSAACDQDALRKRPHTGTKARTQRPLCDIPKRPPWVGAWPCLGMSHGLACLERSVRRRIGRARTLLDLNILTQTMAAPRSLERAMRAHATREIP